MGGEPVYLNIYDLSDQNSWTYWCGVGIFHSGLEAYGVEYAYGGSAVMSPYSCACQGTFTYPAPAGHEYDVSGVFATNPRDAPGPGRAPGVSVLDNCQETICMH